MLKRFLVALAITTAGLSSSSYAATRAEVQAKRAGPALVTSDGADLLAARESAGSNKELASFARKAARRGDELLDMKPIAVTDKVKGVMTDDKHEYASLSPYWWPDPSKPDGKPYIRKDGQYNPERTEYDLDRLEKMSNAVRDLSMAYYFTGDERYAKKSAELIRVWFLDPATRMNPSLKYAQFVPGYDEPRPSGVLEGNRFRRVLDGVAMLEGSSNWSAADDKALKAWFGELLKYMLTSEQGQQEQNQPNNHGTWFHVQAASYAIYIGDVTLATSLIEPAFKERLEKQFNADGMQPEEKVRTMSFHYHRYNLLALFDLAMLGNKVGLDLWNYTTPKGKSLRLGLDFLTPYAVGGEKWPYEQIREIKYGDMVELYRRAANAYNEPKYEAAARKIQEKAPRESVDVLFPAKVKPGK